jgi:hypothetical protein
MSQQGPFLIIANAGRPTFVDALEEARMFPIIDTQWSDAASAVTQIHPAAIIVDGQDANEIYLATLARQVAARKPYLPLIVVDPAGSLPENAVPFSPNGENFDRLAARLRAALRIRALHATALRRLAVESAAAAKLPDINCARDATVLLIGRGGSYAALSVALGECMGVVGAFSIEVAASHLNNRDIDGIVISEGFTTRVMDAFLTVLSEDARFRNLPVMLTSHELAPAHDLPNLEIVRGKPADVAAMALPLIRQHAFETQLTRTLSAIDADGLLDEQTGLLTPSAFNCDLATIVKQTLSEGGGLSIARFAFDPGNAWAQLDGARIISRLMRRTDFGAVQRDGSVVVVFCDADLRTAHAIAKRLSSVMRQTTHGRRNARSEPSIKVATLMPQDSAKSLLARLYGDPERAASQAS